MSDNFDARLVSVEKDVEHLKKESVLHKDIGELLSPMKEDLLLQGTALKQLAQDMSKLSEGQLKTNDTVNAVLKSYDDNLLAQAKAWSVGNVFKITVTVCGGVTAMSGVAALFYALIKFIIRQP